MNNFNNEDLAAFTGRDQKDATVFIREDVGPGTSFCNTVANLDQWSRWFVGESFRVQAPRPDHRLGLHMYGICSRTGDPLVAFGLRGVHPQWQLHHEPVYTPAVWMRDLDEANDFKNAQQALLRQAKSEAYAMFNKLGDELSRLMRLGIWRDVARSLTPQELRKVNDFRDASFPYDAWLDDMKLLLQDMRRLVDQAQQRIFEADSTKRKRRGQAARQRTCLSNMTTMGLAMHRAGLASDHRIAVSGHARRTVSAVR